MIFLIKFRSLRIFLILKVHAPPCQTWFLRCYYYQWSSIMRRTKIFAVNHREFVMLLCCVNCCSSGFEDKKSQGKNATEKLPVERKQFFFTSSPRVQGKCHVRITDSHENKNTEMLIESGANHSVSECCEIPLSPSAYTKLKIKILDEMNFCLITTFKMTHQSPIPASKNSNTLHLVTFQRYRFI